MSQTQLKKGQMQCDLHLPERVYDGSGRFPLVYCRKCGLCLNNLDGTAEFYYYDEFDHHLDRKGESDGFPVQCRDVIEKAYIDAYMI